MPSNASGFDGIADFPGEWPDDEDSLFWNEFMLSQLEIDELYANLPGGWPDDEDSLLWNESMLLQLEPDEDNQ